jgi:ATP-dependent Lon protease
LADIADNVKGALEIVPVSRMDEVLAHALVRKPEPIEWDELNAKRVDVPHPDGESAADVAATAH